MKNRDEIDRVYDENKSEWDSARLAFATSISFLMSDMDCMDVLDDERLAPVMAILRSAYLLGGFHTERMNDAKHEDTEPEENTAL